MSQEAALGFNWRVFLEESRTKESEESEEDYFPPECMEVERILACDENELDMNVLYKQRAQNQREERHAALNPKSLDLDNPKWDPEDYVRYVVKWKGLQFADITWEYWKDIKHDFVDQVEDFWERQKPPNDSVLVAKPHPQMKEFKKLHTSPLFGVSFRKRPVAYLLLDKVEGGNDSIDADDDSKGALRLRGYQLEGVNWLLWNWWNRRSCILADEMGLG